MDILWHFKRILMLLYTCFRFSEVMYQIFLTVRGIASVFVHVVL